MAFEGHPLIRDAAVKAAMQAEFEPILTEFPTIYGKGTLVYKFEDFNGETVKNNGARPLIGVIGGGIVNGKAINLPQPVYPQEGKESCANGTVYVEVLIGEDGNVISAKAISGNELLHKSAVDAAKEAKFNMGHFRIKTQGILVFNFDSLAKCINAGIVNNKALNIPKPSLPQSGHPSHLKLEEGKIVVVEIVVDIGSGRVTYANAISGLPLLHIVCENSARRTKFAPAGNIPPVKVKALLAYKFKPDRTIETDIEEDDKDVAATPINLVEPSLLFCNCKFGSEPKVAVIAEINERGIVVDAEAISGHPLLKQSSKIAALTSTFVPTGEKVKLFITYHFAEVDKWSVKISGIEIKHSKDLETKEPLTIGHSPPNAKPTLEEGIILGTPINLPKPALPPAINWKAPKTAKILVEVEINKEGYVVSAKALTEHIVLKGASVRAARRARFTPTYKKGKPIEAVAKILYQYVFDDDYKFDSEIFIQSIKVKE